MPHSHLKDYQKIDFQPERRQKLGKKEADRLNWWDPSGTEAQDNNALGHLKGTRAVISRLSGALLRAFLVGVLFALPTLILPVSSQSDASVVLIVVLSAFAWTFMEYTSAYPSLLEFRDAPPFNRIRFLALFSTVFALTQIQAGHLMGSTLGGILLGLGKLTGYSLYFPGSPVQLMSDLFPLVRSPLTSATFTASVGMAYLLSLICILTFAAVLHLRRWPRNSGPFNVWINLPTFDPTSTSDVVARLNWDGRVNILLGFLLPFFIPVAARVFAGFAPGISVADPFVTIWVVSAWAFLPSSMIMRGIALQRVAQMIEAHQRIREAQEEGLTAFVN